MGIKRNVILIDQTVHVWVGVGWGGGLKQQRKLPVNRVNAYKRCTNIQILQQGVKERFFPHKKLQDDMK